jgi:hypothetical protein
VVEVGLLRRVLVVAASLVGWCWTSAPGVGRAFSEPSSYVDDAIKGGGGGRWFTGSPAEGYGCDVCHAQVTDAPPYPLYWAGLPTTGYLPGQTYEIALSWPEFAAYDTAVRATMGAEPTSMGVVAEFIAESGIGSGIVEVTRQDAAETELCVFPPKGISTQIYGIRPGAEVEESGRCESSSLGERCIVTVRACGAQELRLKWTAPPQYRDAVWFAAGFVASEQLSNSPAGDSFAKVAVTMRPVAESGQPYESVLGNGCGVATRSSSEVDARWFMLGVPMLLLGARRSLGAMRRRRHRARESGGA